MPPTRVPRGIVFDGTAVTEQQVNVRLDEFERAVNNLMAEEAPVMRLRDQARALLAVARQDLAQLRRGQFLLRQLRIADLPTEFIDQVRDRLQDPGPWGIAADWLGERGNALEGDIRAYAAALAELAE